MENSNLNFIFFGTPKIASDTLDYLKKGGFIPSLIITSPDKPVGRKMLITPTPVKNWAAENNIPYLTPEKIDEDFISKIIGFNFDIAIVVAYGKILPKQLIQAPRLGSINIHYSLLPKYRGASPVESAILQGEKETGVTIQQMEYKMDTGPILSQERISINPDEKALDLHKKLSTLGGELLVKTLPLILKGKITAIPQDESQATYCKKIIKEDGLMREDEDGVRNYNKFRAYATWPRTYFFKDNKRIIVTDAKLEEDKFVIKKVIPEGGKEINYKN